MVIYFLFYSLRFIYEDLLVVLYLEKEGPPNWHRIFCFSQIQHFYYFRLVVQFLGAILSNNKD
jgi:hypothetical protein